MIDVKESVVDILLASLRDIRKIPDSTRKQISDYSSSLTAILNQTGLGWAGRAVPQGPPTHEGIGSLEAFLLDLEKRHPQLKTQVKRARSAVRLIGVPLRDGRGHLPMEMSWTAYSACLTPDDRKILLPLIHWANDRGLRSNDVTSAILEEFAADHLIGRDAKSAIQTVRRIAVTWSGLAAAMGLAAVSQPIPYQDRDWYGHPDPAFATTLLAELDAAVVHWTTVPRRDRTLDPAAAAARRYLVKLSISAHCRATGCLPNVFTSLVTFLEPEKIQVALEYMIARAQAKTGGVKRTDGAYQACRALRDVAALCLPTDHALHDWLNATVTKLAPGARPGKGGTKGARERVPRFLSPRKLRAVLPVLDEVFARKLRSLPSRYYRDLAVDRAPERELATSLVHACALELLMATSLWPYQIAAIQIGTHLKWKVIDGVEVWTLTFEAEDTNHGYAKEFKIVGSSLAILKKYLLHVRRHRPGAQTTFLFPGRDGGSHHANALSQAVSRLVFKETKHKLSAKDLRAAVVIIYALGPNGSEAEVQRFLGRVHIQNDPVINSIRAWLARANFDEDEG